MVYSLDSERYALIGESGYTSIVRLGNICDNWYIIRKLYSLVIWLYQIKSKGNLHIVS